ncbi:MAG: hypothetical protein ABIH23_10240 [bacterium]
MKSRIFNTAVPCLLLAFCITTDIAWSMEQEEIEALLKEFDDAVWGNELVVICKKEYSEAMQQQLFEMMPDQRGDDGAPRSTTGPVTQMRRIHVIAAGGIMRLEEDVPASGINQYPLQQIRQWDSESVIDVSPKSIKPEDGRFLVVEERKGIRKNTPHPFHCRSILTFGRGTSHYIGSPMDLEEVEGQPDCYSLTVWDATRENKAAHFVLDKSKGWCWTEFDYYRKDGGLQARATASDFREVNGTWFPFHCVYESYHEGEKWDIRNEYEVFEHNRIMDEEAMAKQLKELVELGPKDQIIQSPKPGDGIRRK